MLEYKIYDSNSLEELGVFSPQDFAKKIGKKTTQVYCAVRRYLKGDLLNVFGYDLDILEPYYAVYDYYDRLLFVGNPKEVAKYMNYRNINMVYEQVKFTEYRKNKHLEFEDKSVMKIYRFFD